MLAARLAHGSYAISSLTNASEKWSNKAFVRTIRSLTSRSITHGKEADSKKSVTKLIFSGQEALEKTWSFPKNKPLNTKWFRRILWERYKRKTAKQCSHTHFTLQEPRKTQTNSLSLNPHIWNSLIWTTPNPAMNSHFAPGGTLASVFLFLASGGNSLDRSVSSTLCLLKA